jgi:hypothetical protein
MLQTRIHRGRQSKAKAVGSSRSKLFVESRLKTVSQLEDRFRVFKAGTRSAGIDRASCLRNQ